MRQTDLVVVIMFLFVVCASAPLSGEADTSAVVIAGSDDVGLSVEKMCFCAAIKDRTPIGVADTFPSDIFSVYCYTRILGAEDTTTVVHAWHRDETRVTGVKLIVGSPRWRTWSQKKMTPEWRGDWRVDVIAPDSSVIASKKFFLE